MSHEPPESFPRPVDDTDLFADCPSPKVALRGRACGKSTDLTPIEECCPPVPLEEQFRIQPSPLTSMGRTYDQLTRPLDPPAPTEEPSVHDLVMADIQDRKAFGLEKYGTVLQASNGRDHLVDAYQEALDLCCYLRAAIARRDS